MSSLRANLLTVLMVSLVLEVQSNLDTCDDLPSSPPVRGRALLQTPANKKTAHSSHMVVPLERIRGRSVGVKRGMEVKNFYVGNIAVGHPPQKFQVVFDTSSGHTILPHRVCKSRACMEHKRYSSVRSFTAVDVDFNGSRVQKRHRLAKGKNMRDAATTEMTQADLGTGKATAVVVRDTVCLLSMKGNKTCTRFGIMAAITMDDMPFRAMPADGSVGLGLLNLSPAPLCSFFGQMVNRTKNFLPMFGISYGATGGELHIGGYDPAVLKAPLQWFPVHSPEEGFWQVPIYAVRVGNITVNSCLSGCHAIIDTSASRLGVQDSNLPKLQSALKSWTADDGSCRGPILEFDLGGMAVNLGPDDYTGTFCEPDLGSLDLQEPNFFGVYAFGEVVLRHYFVAFDWQDKVIGFAPTSVETRQAGEPAAGAGVEKIFM